ncbi:ATP-binding protein [Kitasatospora sp. NPDC056651]|uniref:ATP-binding protein n=1 Tax=Kitasatospora sp. NPDC056651 TaxID=3345892 RepID=UPI003688D42D
MGETTNHFSHADAGSVFQARTMVVNQLPASAAEPPHASALPAAGMLVGREAELAEVLAVLDPAGDGRVRAVVLSGIGGAGKSALAVSAAHDAQRRGWFTGVLYVTLHGYAPRSGGEVAAPEILLRQLGVPDGEIPQDQAGREARYRTELAGRARRGQRFLVVVDDASAAEQVRPLVPADPAHRVLVTSRHVLADLDGARLLELGGLADGSAVDLLDQVLRDARPTDGRVAAEPGAAAEVAERCAGLPLALRIVAALLASEPEQPVRELAAILADARGRLAELDYGGSLAVRAAFDLSYGHLNAEQARIFSLLSLAPGPHVGLEAAVHLAGRPEGVVRRALGELRRAHMIEQETLSHHRRYRFHDLLRLYAVERAESDLSAAERETAVDRVLRFHVRAAHAAQTLLGENEQFRAPLLAWFDADLPCLVAAVELASATGRATVAQDLPFSLVEFFELRSRWDAWSTCYRHAAAAARSLGNGRKEAAALNGLAAIRTELGAYDEAREHVVAALALLRESEDRELRIGALNQLGVIERGQRRFARAVELHEEALALCRSADDRDGEAMTRHNLGSVRVEQGAYQDALEQFLLALETWTATGDTRRAAHVRSNLGMVYRRLGRQPEAMAEHETALEVARADGNLREEGRLLSNIGLVLLELERYDEALENFDRSRDLLRSVGDRPGETNALQLMGATHLVAKDYDRAFECGARALEMAQELGDWVREIRILMILGRCLLRLGDREQAVDCFESALSIATEHADDLLIAQIWTFIGRKDVPVPGVQRIEGPV